MPLPLGHTAIGIAVHELCSKDNSSLSRWKTVVFIAVLANLPDIDVVIGLLFQGNGNAFHRGPTHSLLFALLIGLFASNARNLCPQVSKISFRDSFLIVFSHVLADFYFTSSPVSFLWPLEVKWTAGYSGWGDVMNSVFFQPFDDARIIMGCGVVIILNRVIRVCFDHLRATMRKYNIFAN